MGNLTKKQVAELSKPGRYGDGNGLYLVIAPTGTKNWVQRVRVDGKRTDRGLGGVGKVSLAQARKFASANQVALQQGRNPVVQGRLPSHHYETCPRRDTDVPRGGGASLHPATLQERQE